MQNQFFQNLGFDQELSLYNEVIEESINASGFSIHYIPREYAVKDKVLNEITTSKFTNIYIIPAYLEESGGWQNNDYLLSKFGMSFSGASATFAVSKRAFKSETPLDAPKTGDIFYIQGINRFFEIKDIKTQDPFVSKGQDFYWKFVSEPYKWSEDDFSEADKIIDKTGADILSKFRNDMSLALEAVPLTVDDNDFTIDADYDIVANTIDSEEFIPDGTIDSTEEFLTLNKTINNSKIDSSKELNKNKPFGFE